MFAPICWSSLIASILTLAVASSTLADDVFVKEGVVVKPLSKRKQRKLEKKLLKRPGNEVVIEGTPTAAPVPEVITRAKARRSLRPLFPDRFNRRNDVVVTPSVVTSPSSVVSIPRTVLAPGDPLVMPGSVDVTPSPRVVRPPVISTPKGPSRPVDPTDEPEPEPELETERPASARILPPPADEIPPPVVSTPRKPSTSPAPSPAPKPASPDQGPSTGTPPAAPEPEPVVEPPLELPQAPKPA